MKTNVKAIAKLVIALLVVFGLGLTIKKSIDELAVQRSSLDDQVAIFDDQIANAASDNERQTLRQKRQQVIEAFPSLANVNWPTIIIAGLVYTLGLATGGLVLREATRLLGYRVTAKDAIAFQTVGHLGKYVPGKAMVVVLRAGRLREQGVPWLAGSTSVFMETIMMMAVGAALAGTLIMFLPVDRWIAWCALLGGIAGAMLSLPPILGRIIRKLGVQRSEEKETDQDIAEGSSGRSWRFFAAAWFWHLWGWFLIGGAFALIVFSLPGRLPETTSLTLFLASVAAMALAMVLGFASLIPGGAGVRELTLTVILSPVVGPTTALVAAILTRLLFVAVELALAFALGGFAKLRNSSQPDLSAATEHRVE
ncbi:flippase-like domain-containing protein [Stieleria sp. JC731]|uniref:lysylphosphatidylglycerol synthase transmembrane domain-containing protein n=1 Tax=Pirellulaceae TaxID=2691357 RepID=UPI001E36B449|nr:lysylphosphatidylglycerol synthase transmembrane domain-containing protein [Stieleria sp. JC731]MCC9601615.1 flippase-like domain-containing protein [Stieleria sp. JC731]